MRNMPQSVPVTKRVEYSETLTFFEGDWHSGNVPIMGPRTHGAWLASTAFDGARAFEGVAPDLDRHCERVNRSAANFKLKPVVDAETWLALAHEGIARFGAKAELYIRPMYGAQTGSGGGVLSRNHELVLVHLCCANAADYGRCDHAVAVSATVDRKRAGGLQGGLSLSKQLPGLDRGSVARLR